MDVLGVPRLIQLMGRFPYLVALRTTGKIMTHKLKAIKEKTKARRSGSTVLLPDHWAMLRVAKLLHNFANRYVKMAARGANQNKDIKVKA
jgi:hypothetical protein